MRAHESYADFDRFMAEHKRVLGDLLADDDATIINLDGSEILKPLHLKYLADAI